MGFRLQFRRLARPYLIVAEQDVVIADLRAELEACRDVVAEQNERHDHAMRMLDAARDQVEGFAAADLAKAEEVVRLHAEVADVRRAYGDLERSHAQLREAHDALGRRHNDAVADARKLRRKWAAVCDAVNQPMDGE